jgi:hypothetical protein
MYFIGIYLLYLYLIINKVFINYMKNKLNELSICYKIVIIYYNVKYLMVTCSEFNFRISHEISNIK